MVGPDNATQETEGQKVARYSYLLPSPSASLMSKMNDGLPDGDDASNGAQRASIDPALLPPPDWAPIDAAARRDRALGCLLGLAVGDAVGTTVEFKARGSFAPLTDMVGGGPFGLKPGEWTDDTTMALCLGQSLCDVGTLDQEDFMTRMRAWMERGENSVNGRCFDIGNTTRDAIETFIRTGSGAAGSQEPHAAGNGSLIRLAPVAIFAAADRDEAEFLARKQSRATHGNPECLDACKLFVSQLLDALDGADKHGATRPRVMSLASKLLFISAGEWKTKPRDAIQSTGYVVHTLEAALWSVWQTDNFRDAILTAANLGDDADSVAATAGQLAGALYGASGIPQEWLDKLAWRDRIETLATDLFNRDRD